MSETIIQNFCMNCLSTEEPYQSIMKSSMSFLFLFVGALTFFGSALAQEPVPEGYRFDTGDKIYIKVFDEDDLTMQTVVGASGAINFSFLGTVQVAGRTSTELEVALTERLADGYLVNPSVNVSIVEYRPFFINGEVKRPGSYSYQPGLNLDRAIAIAGGLTDRASKRKIFIEPASAEASEKSKRRVSLESSVNPGDIITVEEGFF